MVFTLILMVTMTFWNGFATLLDKNSVDAYDSVAMWLFFVVWILFTGVLAAVIFVEVSCGF